MSSYFHSVFAMNTLGAGLLNGAIGWTIMLFTLVTGRTDGMQAWAIMSCKALWLRQNEADVPRRERAEISTPAVQPVLLDVKQASVYLGRSEQAIQHLIFQRDLPVVRMGRRVHLDRRDLDIWIEKNKY